MTLAPAPLRAATLALTFALMLAPAAAHAEASAACAADETTVFACTAAGGKRIAVCADAAHVQYRYGRPGAPELVYPPADADWRAVTRGGVLSFSGGGGAFLAFTRGAYRYVVYTAIGRGWGLKDGVAIEKDGQRIASVRCQDRPQSLLGQDWYDSARVPAADEDFELP